MTEVHKLSKLAELIFDTVKLRCESYCHLSGLKSSDLDQLEAGHFCKNMVMILLNSPQIDLQLKIFYEEKSSAEFIEKLPRSKASENNDEALTSDMYKEVANLTIGHIKTVLEQSGIACEMSLPIAMRGYDDLFSNEKKYPHSIEKNWKLQLKKSMFICHCSIEAKDLNFTIDDQDLPVEGEIDFL